VLHLILGLIAVGLLAVLARGVFVFFKPYRPCRWCRPGGLPGWRRRRRKGCWRCDGHQLTRRLGAHHVHKLKLSVIEAIEEWRDRP